MSDDVDYKDIDDDEEEGGDDDDDDEQSANLNGRDPLMSLA